MIPRVYRNPTCLPVAPRHAHCLRCRGGAGQAVILLGQALGAKLIAVDRRPFDAGDYKGVDLLGHIDTSRQRLGDAVREFTGGKGADLALDGVGGELFEPVLSTLTQLGRQTVHHVA